MGWTSDQEDAINARNGSVLVSAAAGSGKTSVLVERLIRQLADTENKIPADRMIVVTFTKDAATEMKQRLTVALAQLIEEQPDNQWLNRQQLLLQSAKISTIHSFCFELIRDNINDLELSGSFRIMDETEAKLLTAKTISELLDDYYENHPDKTEMLYDQFCYKDDSTLEVLIYEIYEFISSVPYGISWLEQCRDGYSDNGVTFTKICDEYTGHIINMLNKATELSAECAELVTDCENQKCIDIIDTEYFAITKISDIFCNTKRTLMQKAAEYHSPDFARLVLGKNFDVDTKERIQLLRGEYKKIIKDDISDATELVKYAQEDFEVHFKVLSVLTQMIGKLEQRLWKAKVEKSCIGFSDAETLTVRLLSSVDDKGNIVKSPLAHELSEYYKIIMIDEFQDTNNNQDMIFKLLSHGGTAEHAGDNMFMVGDVKQSIYRFRLANPKNFINTMARSVKYSEKTDNENSYIQLNRNFRSSIQVIDFVNFIFRSVMSRKVGDIVYNCDEELVRGAEFTERNRNTEVALLVQDDNSKYSASARYTAQKIDSMLKNKVQVDNKDKESTRDCTMRDFCILLRRKTDASEYISELAKLGIPAYSEETAGYLRSREISVLLNILRVTDNPLIDTSLVAIMLSPMFMITDEELARLRVISRNGHIYDAVYAVLENDQSAQKTVISEELRIKLQNAADTIAEFRMYAATMNLVELIRRIYDRTDFISVIRMYDNSEKKRANLRALLEYAKMYQKVSDDGLSGFLRYIDRMIKINGDFRQGQTVSTSEDVVMIKTIHKSKGLEFPFVFLCATDVLFNTSDARKNIQINFENGIGFRLQNRREYQRYPTLPYEVLSRINTSDSVSEEMRLLYVALTRAKEQLFIPLKIGKSQKDKLSKYAVNIYQYQGITPVLSGEAKSMSDWLLMSLLTHKNGNLLREMSDCDMFFIQDDKTDIDFKMINADEILNDDQTCEKQVEEKVVSADDDLVREILKDFRFIYDYSLSELQSKVSVSDISKKGEGVKTLRRPEFMQEDGRISASERGTVIHSILQHANFKKLSEDASSEIIAIADKGFITKSQRDIVDEKLISRFTDSELFRHIISSSYVQRERKFLMKISDLDLPFDELRKYDNTDSMIQGIIDLYYKDNDGLVLVDYKTDNVSDMSQLVSKYSMQLSLYKAALEKIENETVTKTVIFSLRLGRSVIIDI